ncbi:hypothetical protein RF11_01523 [Thelohanellus kitauei]|uniref:Uncharacterized protein n=1 Tax=Thelohanellus kitauei TaxID=669202 RepID=A0A0C2IU72_THEKT|nr:hypothetical protein RF11_01523 [Thelohanellus kitauei]
MTSFSVCLLVKTCDTTVLDFPSTNPTHRLEFDGYLMDQCDHALWNTARRDVIRTMFTKNVENQRNDVSDKDGNVPIRKFLWVVRMWAHNQILIASFLSISPTTSAKMTKSCRNVKLSTLNLTLGGPGIIIQIDESVISRAMHNRGHDLLRPKRWVLGMYEATLKLMFLIKMYIGIVICIPNRKADTERINYEKYNLHIFRGKELNETFDQSVNDQTFSSKWVEDNSIIYFYFNLETSETYYGFTDIGVDIQITNDKLLLLRSKLGEPEKYHYSYKTPNNFYIGKRQTNCTFTNIQITLPEVYEFKCSLLMNFTYLRFEFLEENVLLTKKSTTTIKLKPSKSTSKHIVYLIVGLAVSILLIILIVVIIYILHTKKLIIPKFAIQHSVSKENKT